MEGVEPEAGEGICDATWGQSSRRQGVGLPTWRTCAHTTGGAPNTSSPAVELQTSPKGGGRPAVPLTRSRTAPSQSSVSHFRTELSPGRLHLQITACQLARGDAQAHDWYLMSVLGARLLIRRDVPPLWGRVRTRAGLEPGQALRTPSRCPTPWFI